MNKVAPIWIAFALLAVITPIVYKFAYAMPGYWIVLPCLAVAAIVLAILALRGQGLHLWSIVAVLGGLLIGQWWLIKSAIVLAFMKWRGFAP
jgi:hypothetical protein